MPRKTGQEKDRTSLVISLVLHVLIIAGVGYWAWKSGVAEKVARKILGIVRTEKQEKKPDAPIQTKAPPPPLPKINEGMPPPASSGTRRAVASDAPEAAGDSFFQDLRKQVQGPGGGSTGPTQKVEAPKIVVAPPKPILPPMRAAGPSTIAQLLTERSKAVAATEAVGSEQISKAGASDAGGAVTKVAGATIVGGKFAVIRGLNDRYVTTTLNGAGLPSADPYRQSASLDLFPAQVIDRLVVSKTFTPDQPGTYTGGGIDILTKSFPERPFFSVTAGGSYNPQVNLNDKFLTYDGGGKDWLAMDDGKRDMPGQLEGVDIPPKPDNSGPIGNPNVPPYPTLVFQTNANNAALLDKLSRAMPPTQFAPERDAPPLNHNFSAAGGGSAFMFGRPLGYFASTSYRQDYSFFEDAISTRYGSGTELKSRYNDTRAVTVGNWSTMVNLAYQPIDNHELGFTYFYNQNAVDEARIQDHGTEQAQPGLEFRKFNLYWTERNLNTFQFKGDHRFPDVGDVKFDWLVALTGTTQDEPNARFFNDYNAGEGWKTGGNNVPTPSNPTQYDRELDEDNRNIRLNWTIPFHTWTEEDGQFKFGLFDSQSDRTFTDRAISWYEGDSATDYLGDPNLFLTQTNRGLSTIQTNYNPRNPTQIRSYTYHWNHFIENFDSLYDAELGVKAGYLMLDLPPLPKVRLVGGVRYEVTDMSIHSESYRDNTVTGLRTNDSEIMQYDLLPSAGLIYSVKDNMNFRLIYSQTVARPSFRELAAYFSYDPTINDFIDGNPELQMTAIDNYDFRWEWFPRPGEVVGISLFYKDLKNAIERGDVKQEGDSITFFNRDEATLWGIEFEVRKNLDFLSRSLRYYSIGGNLSLIESEVELTDTELNNKREQLDDPDKTRPLYDQSPYIANVDLSYANPFSGTVASLLFNLSGERIAITKLNTEDIYEQPAPSLDFLISQRIGRHMTLRFGVRNMLDPKIERLTGRHGESGVLPYDSYRRGRNFGFSVTYDF